MEKHTLARDGARDIRFTGELIAEVSSHHYEGPRNTRWTELRLFRTAAGTLVCHEIGRTIWQGETDRYQVHKADTEADLIDLVGTGSLAKDLYDSAGIECVDEID